MELCPAWRYWTSFDCRTEIFSFKRTTLNQSRNFNPCSFHIGNLSYVCNKIKSHLFLTIHPNALMLFPMNFWMAPWAKYILWHEKFYKASSPSLSLSLSLSLPPLSSLSFFPPPSPTSIFLPLCILAHSLIWNNRDRLVEKCFHLRFLPTLPFKIIKTPDCFWFSPMFTGTQQSSLHFDF